MVGSLPTLVELKDTKFSPTSNVISQLNEIPVQ